MAKRKLTTAAFNRRGSFVGYGDNQWVAIRDTNTAPPGNDWRPAILPPDESLISKVPGPPGRDSNVPGPAGRDSTVPGPAGKDAEQTQPLGEWSESKQYPRLALVLYENDSWIASEANRGKTPGISSVWQLIARSIRGPRGESGGAGARGRAVRFPEIIERLDNIESQLEPQEAIAAENIIKSQVLVINEDGKAELAVASQPYIPSGICVQNTLAGEPCKYLATALIEFSEWLLQPGATYYLSLVPGAITTTSPTGDGAYSIVVGSALSESLLRFDPQRVVLL